MATHQKTDHKLAWKNKIILLGNMGKLDVCFLCKDRGLGTDHILPNQILNLVFWDIDNTLMVENFAGRKFRDFESFLAIREGLYP